MTLVYVNFSLFSYAAGFKRYLTASCKTVNLLLTLLSFNVLVILIPSLLCTEYFNIPLLYKLYDLHKMYTQTTVLMEGFYINCKGFYITTY